MSKFTRIYFATLSVYSIFWVFAIWFFENSGTTIIKVLATIALSLIAIAGVFVVFQHEDKEKTMEIRKFERYGNDCILYTTLILDDDVLIVIERANGSWCDSSPIVTVYEENAQEKFEELVKELEDKGE